MKLPQTPCGGPLQVPPAMTTRTTISHHKKMKNKINENYKSNEKKETK